MDYLWDTSVLLHFIRETNTYRKLESNHHFFNVGNFTMISVVSMGEILSLSLKLNWGRRRKEKMEQLLEKTPISPIFRREILDAYAEIDAFSQGRHPTKSLPKVMSARNMGKNDIWIAATAYAFQKKIKVVTSDNDFDHLQNEFLELIKF